MRRHAATTGPTRVVVLSLVVSVLAAVAGGSAHASRIATSQEQQRIGAEVHLMMSLWADSPDSGILHGTQVVLLPICISTVDDRYGLAVANPVVHGIVGQSGVLFVRRVSNGYRVLGDLLTGDQANDRPLGVPKNVYSDIHRTCNPAPSTKAVLHARARHSAPIFVI